MFQHAVDFVRSSQYRQPAKFSRAVTDGTPARQIVVSSLKMDKVLMDGRRVFCELWKPQPCDLLWLWHHRTTADSLQQIHHFAAVCDFVKRLQPVDLVINVRVFGVAFRTASIRIGDAIDGVSSLDKPSSGLHQRQHFPPQV